ncbi:MAG: hypothetical protein ACKOW9_06465 [Candidatus Paceibacterota bacterium]
MEEDISHETLIRLAESVYHDSYKSQSAKIILDILLLHTSTLSELTTPPTPICGCGNLYPCKTVQLIKAELTKQY